MGARLALLGEVVAVLLAVAFCASSASAFMIGKAVLWRGIHGHRRRGRSIEDGVRRLCTALDSEDFASSVPSSFQSAFMQTLHARGFIHQCTDFTGLDSKFHSGCTTAYLGFDATAPSLHVGSLLQIMLLRRLQQAGHKPIVLVGGGTTRIGDPTGKEESRTLLTEEAIRHNMDSLSTVFSKFLTFGNGPTDAILVNNADWLDSLRYLDFLRDFGRLVSVNRMLSFESVKQRLAREQPLTFLEFNYILLQSYDFVELHRRYNVTVQLGGSDQWGNIVSGVELGRKTHCAQPLFGLTAPLMTTADGKKMGKTASGAVWLNRDMLGEYDYWQFWRNTADADVIRFLKLFTDLPLETIAPLERLQGSDLNAAKRLLADECTRLLHGDSCLADIHRTVDSLFSSRSGGSDLGSLPQLQLTPDMLSDGRVSVVDLLVRSGLTSSKGEAKRLIAAGGAKVNDRQVGDERQTVGEEDFNAQKQLKLSSGKKKHAAVLWPR